MQRLFQIAFCALMLAPSLSRAQDFQAGVTAAKSGDYAVALREWTPLAEQGDATAQHFLGHLYANGQGVAQDHAEAVKWYRLAAEQGDVKAQHNLAIMYANGQGVPQDYITAHMWWNIAASQGEKAAASNRDKITGRLQPADIFEALTAKDRPYKDGKTLTESLTILGKFKENGHIDPDLFDVFIREKVYLEYADRFLNKAQIDEVDVSKIPGYSP